MVSKPQDPSQTGIYGLTRQFVARPYDDRKSREAACVEMADNPRTGTFSPQARQAAAETKRRLCEEKSPVGAPKVFVVRMVGPRQPFGWEIRKFCSFIVSRSDKGFTTQLEAQTAGEKALVALIAA